MTHLSEGCSAKKTFLVQEQDSAEKVGSGGLPVLATPTLAAWVENTAFELLELHVEDDETSVGMDLDLKHLAPTPIGLKVTITLTVEKIDKRKIHFSFIASDPIEQIGEGKHTRVIVDKNKFMAKVNKKNGSQ